MKPEQRAAKARFIPDAHPFFSNAISVRQVSQEAFFLEFGFIDPLEASCLGDEDYLTVQPVIRLVLTKEQVIDLSSRMSEYL